MNALNFLRLAVWPLWSRYYCENIMCVKNDRNASLTTCAKAGKNSKDHLENIEKNIILTKMAMNLSQIDNYNCHDTSNYCFVLSCNLEGQSTSENFHKTMKYMFNSFSLKFLTN